jgi:hypothetical protein
MEQCSGPTQRLFEKLLGSHVLRLWRRFKEIDTDNDGRIGDYDIREWLHRVTPAEASAEKLLLALELAADEPVDAQRFEQLVSSIATFLHCVACTVLAALSGALGQVCLKDGVVSLRSQLTGMAAGELEAPLAAVTNRFKRAVNEISVTNHCALHTHHCTKPPALTSLTAQCWTKRAGGVTGAVEGKPDRATFSGAHAAGSTAQQQQSRGAQGTYNQLQCVE